MTLQADSHAFPHPPKPRARLAEWLPEVRPQAWLLVAGPGMGKSYAARAIAEALSQPVRWLEAADLMAGHPPEGLLGPDTTLVIEGAERLIGTPGLALLASWLKAERHPLIVVSRQPLPLPLARRVAAGRVVRLGPDDLTLDPAEAATWLGTHLLSAETLSAIAGWPLGVQALTQPDTATPEVLNALVDEEWLAPLPPEELAMLRRLSLAARLTPAVWAGLGPVAPPLIERWVAWGLFRRSAQETYMWRPLVRARLSEAWQRETPLAAQKAELTQAARALEGEDPAAAVSLLLAGDQLPEAAALARRAGKRWLLVGELAPLSAMLDLFPASAAEQQPILALLHGAVEQARGAYAEAEGRYRQALARFELRGDRALTFEALGDLVHLFWTMEDPAKLAATTALAAAREADACVAEKVEFWNNLACQHFGAEQEAEAERLWGRVLDTPHFEDAQIASVQQFAAINMGILAKERGAFEAAMRHFQHVVELSERFPLKPSIPRGAQLYRAMVALKLGDRAQAEACFQAIASLPIPPEDRYRRAEFLQVEGDYHLLTGAFDAAEASYQEALVLFTSLRMDTNADAGLAHNQLAVLNRRRGETDAALVQHGLARPLVSPWPRYRARVAIDTAITLLAAGRPAEAGPYLAEADEAVQRVPAVHISVALGLARAAWHDRSGEPEKAAHALAPALALIRQERLYFAPIAQREIAPDLWALMARLGETAMLESIESRFPGPAGRIRALLAARPAAPALPPVAAPAIAIRCFGGLSVEVAGEIAASWPRKRAKALLGWLVLHPEGLSREELVDSLLPDLGFEEGQHQLDNLLSSLRKILEPQLAPRQKSRYLEVKERRVRLLRAGFFIDLEAFERLHQTGQAAWARGDQSEAIAAFEAAVALYRGDLLAEPVTQDWFDVERHRARMAVVPMWLRLAEAAREQGHHEQARAYLERLLAVEPAHEEAHQQLMRLYAFFDQPQLVKRQYEWLEKALRSELDEVPTAASRALLKQLVGAG